LREFNVAYKARRQRVLAAKTPSQIVQERLAFICSANHSETNTRVGSCDLTNARLIVKAAKQVSQPDRLGGTRRYRRFAA
jgi:hypothetical protein